MSTASVGARVRTDPRISRRRRAVAREQRRRLFLRSAVVASLGVFAWTAFWSPLLKVERVRIVGGVHSGERRVARAAGLDTADNLLLVSPRTIAQRVESLSWVRAAEVDRRLPDTVRIKVRERRPSLILAVGAQRWLVDAHGRVLGREAAERGGVVGKDRGPGTGVRHGRRSSGRGNALPVLAGAPLERLVAGERLSDPAARGAIAAYGALPRKVRGSVRAMFAPSPERIGFSLTEGMQIRYGAAERMRAKGAVLQALLRRLRVEGRSAAYLDVRVPTRPAVSNLPVGARFAGAP